MRTRSLLVAVAAALAGCSLSLKTDKIDPLKDAEGYCDTLFAEYVKKVDACVGATQYWVDQQYAAAKTMCANIGTANVTYDRDAAQRFVDAIRAADCRSFDQYMEDGDAPLVGNVPAYGACNSSLECAGYRSQCVNTTGTCPGQCFQQGVSGDPCYEGYPECAPGYWCDMSYSSPGYPGSCVQSGGQYYDCTASYWSWDVCASGLRCKYMGGSPAYYQCLPYIPAGGDCSADSGGCTSGTYCRSDNICAEYQSVGTYCDIGSDFYRCDPNGDAPSICDMSSHRCIAQGHIGEPCVFGTWCLEGYCNAAQLRCVARAGLGASCVVGQNACEMGAYCAGAAAGLTGVCTTWPMHIGNPCGNINGEWAECFEGYCGVTYGPGIYYCAAVMQVGDLCSGYALNDPCRPDMGMNDGARCDSYSGTCTPSCN